MSSEKLMTIAMLGDSLAVSKEAFPSILGKLNRLSKKTLPVVFRLLR